MQSSYFLTEKRLYYLIYILYTYIATIYGRVNVWDHVCLCIFMYVFMYICMHERCHVEFPWEEKGGIGRIY